MESFFLLPSVGTWLHAHSSCTSSASVRSSESHITEPRPASDHPSCQLSLSVRSSQSHVLVTELRPASSESSATSSSSSTRAVAPAEEDTEAEGQRQQQMGISGTLAAGQQHQQHASSSMSNAAATVASEAGRQQQRSLTTSKPVLAAGQQSVSREISEAEAKLMALHKLEAKTYQRSDSRLLVELATLFEFLPDDAVLRVRAELDSGLIFRQDGSAADLRALVFDDMKRADRLKVLRRIYHACSPPPAEHRGFVVLSDVDDTLLPGHDALKISGSDRSWHLDGRLYPGVSRLHRELRNGLRESCGGDYSVLLTARPPFLVQSLGKKLRRITGVQKPRMSILPGAEGTWKAVKNAWRVLTGDYNQLGETKVERIKEYAQLFPEFAGRFVFIGDDGQADLKAAEEMLGLTVSSLGPLVGNTAGLKADTPLLAFAAIHATVVQQGSCPTFALHPRERLATINRIRQQRRAVKTCHSNGQASGLSYHRFFYFEDYAELAKNLEGAGWIYSEQLDAILAAHKRDCTLPDLTALVDTCDLKGLRKGINDWSENVNVGDETEQEAFELAGAALAHVVRAHLQLAVPLASTTSIALQVLGVRFHADSNLKWPHKELATTLRLALHDVNSRAKSGSSVSQVIECNGNGKLRVPWPSGFVCRGDAKPAIDVKAILGPGSNNEVTGRFFVVSWDTPGAARHGSVVDVALVTQSDTPDVFNDIGEVTLQVVWEPGPPQGDR
eukprot:TRINITY_DN58350_c0_g1_i1.p1 TRINITY_DN58350_c0_g1~~TRINITY_DN58350_c0_g1_i1.p1  ORF type:complete len:730 (-),score=109.51 TRINITY_DN58350_c0_g1_i1:402-2591(-)